MNRLFVVAMLALAPMFACASLQINSAVDCSGALSIFASALEPSRIECTGNLSFAGASVFSSTPFSIVTTNDLSFLDVLVSAPQMTFKAGGVMLIESFSVFAAPLISLEANSIVLDGRIISTVPETSTFALLLAGLGMIGAFVQRRRT
jgi:hypothetical protein